MIDKVKARIAEALAEADEPCVMWSGGLDSSVVLELALQVKPDIDICQFRADFSPSQKAFVDRIVADKEIRVYSWSPKFRFFGPFDENGKAGMELADVYAWGDAIFPVVRTCLKGTKCLLDADPTRTPEITPRWDLFLTGVLGTDREYGLPVATEGYIGPTRLYSPLFDMAKQDVTAMALQLGLELDRPDTGSIRGCTECLMGTRRGEKKVWCPKAQRKIDTVQWDADDNHRLLINLLTGR